jgi:molybdopterin-guanine dinucleotide biosynthesis protein A
VTFDGAVLCGGASSRMGRDKAFVEVDGVAMARRVADAMRDAGARAVVAVGGNEAALADLGLSFVPDQYPGQGPLGGILTALTDREDVVVIAACDMPWITAAQITPLVTALAADPSLDAALSEQHLLGAWRASALPTIAAAFADGERSPRRALTQLKTVTVELPVGSWSNDVDRPEDLSGR